MSADYLLLRLIAIFIIGATTLPFVVADTIDFEFWIRNSNAVCSFNGLGSKSQQCAARDNEGAVWGACGLNTATNQVYCCGAKNNICHREGDECEAGNENQISCSYRSSKKWCCQKDHEACEPSGDRFYGEALCVPAKGTNPYYNHDPKVPGSMWTPTYTFPVSIPGASYTPESVTPASKTSTNAKVTAAAAAAASKSRASSAESSDSDAGATPSPPPPTAPAEPVSDTQKETEDDGNATPLGAIVGGAVGGVVGLILIGVLAWVFMLRRHARDEMDDDCAELQNTAIAAPDDRKFRFPQSPAPAPAVKYDTRHEGYADVEQVWEAPAPNADGSYGWVVEKPS